MVTEVALVVVQERTELWPAVMLAGLALRCTVGAGVEGGAEPGGVVEAGGAVVWVEALPPQAVIADVIAMTRRKTNRCPCSALMTIPEMLIEHAGSAGESKKEAGRS
jgi:hypothetical protein